MSTMKENSDRRALELCIWKMSRAGLPDHLIAAALRVSRQDLSRLKGEKIAA